MEDKNKTTSAFDKKNQEPIRKANAPCPKCHSWNTTVENGIFVCHNCGFDGG